MTTINAKYGRDPTVTFYTHVSDQCGPFYTKVINSTVLDALHVLEGLQRRLIQAAGDQLFFFATGSRLATPTRRFFSRICWKVGVLSGGARFLRGEANPDTAPAFHRMSMESEGKKTLKGRGYMRVRP